MVNHTTNLIIQALEHKVKTGDSGFVEDNYRNAGVNHDYGWCFVL